MEFDIWTVLSIVLTGVATLAAGFWVKAKGKLGHVKDLIKKGYDVVEVAIEALDDDKLTKEEAEIIKKKAQEVIVAWKKLIGK
jgi:hypothetical protein